MRRRPIKYPGPPQHGQRVRAPVLAGRKPVVAAWILAHLARKTAAIADRVVPAAIESVQ